MKQSGGILGQRLLKLPEVLCLSIAPYKQVLEPGFSFSFWNEVSLGRIAQPVVI